MQSVVCKNPSITQPVFKPKGFYKTHELHICTFIERIKPYFTEKHSKDAASNSLKKYKGIYLTFTEAERISKILFHKNLRAI